MFYLFLIVLTLFLCYIERILDRFLVRRRNKGNLSVSLQGYGEGLDEGFTVLELSSNGKKKLPTGIFYLDWYTEGGIPLDRITRIGGWSPVSNINDVTGDVEIEFPTLKAEEAL